MAHSIVHRVLWEYLSNIKDLASEEEQTRLRQEMFDRYTLHFNSGLNYRG